jgi:hypothetical protein
MKKKFFYSSVLLLFLVMRSVPAHAFGIGLFGNFDGGQLWWDGYGTSYDFLNYGGGLVFDTNLAGNSLFNYRMELGVSNIHSNYEADTPIYGVYTTKYEDSIAISSVNYFGFGIVRSQYVRFWLGPQLTFGGTVTNLTGFYAGLGVALGLNFNFGDVFTLAVTGSGRYLFSIRDYTEGSSKYISYGLGWDGMVTLAFLFRFSGDTYNR